jgi:hypothetical protein
MHMKARMAAAAEAGDEEGFGDEKDQAKKYVAVPKDEILTDTPMSTCLGCHNKESPSFQPFCFYKARATFSHLNPLKPRTAEEKAQLLVCGCGDTCGCVHGCEEGKCGVPPKESK